jgi:hypothetical protein
MANNDPIQEVYEDIFRKQQNREDAGVLSEDAPVEDPKKAVKDTPEQDGDPEDLTPDSDLPDGKELDTDPVDVPGVEMVSQNAPSEDEEDEVDDEEDEDETKPPFESFNLDLESIISESLKDKTDVAALINDESLSEDTKSNLAEVFNAAIRAKVSVIAEHIMQAAQNRLAEMNDHNNKEVTEQVDQYLDYVVTEWLEENKLAVDKGIRTEVTESFMRGLRGLLNEHHVVVDEDRRDLIDELENKIGTLESQINEQLKKEIVIRKETSDVECKNVFAEVSESLLDTEKEKFAKLAEGLEYDTIDQYRSKLEILKKSYFSRRPAVTGSSNPEPELNDADITEGSQPVSSEDPVMNSYLQSINRQVREF